MQGNEAPPHPHPKWIITSWIGNVEKKPTLSHPPCQPSIAIVTSYKVVGMGCDGNMVLLLTGPKCFRYSDIHY